MICDYWNERHLADQKVAWERGVVDVGGYI
jgi:hypothetical protein